MVTTHVEIVAPLPPLFSRRLEDLLSRSILGAIAIVGIVLTKSASLCSTRRAGCSLAGDAG